MITPERCFGWEVEDPDVKGLMVANCCFYDNLGPMIPLQDAVHHSAIFCIFALGLLKQYLK